MIEVRGLTKRYGEVLAVDDLTFTVRPGEVTVPRRAGEPEDDRTISQPVSGGVGDSSHLAGPLSVEPEDLSKEMSLRQCARIEFAAVRMSSRQRLTISMSPSTKKGLRR